MIIASSYGHTDICRYLLHTCGAQSVNTEIFGWTALHSAASHNYLEVVNVLLEFGADPSIKNSDGLTALDYARARK